MRSAADFLPCSMIEFMNLVSTISPNFGSGMISRLSALRRRDMVLYRLYCYADLFRPLRSVFRTALPARTDALRIQHATNDVIAHTGQILDATAADHDHRMLLQIVTLARDVARHLKTVGETNASDLPQGRVWLLRRRRIDARADTPFLRAGLHRRNLIPLTRLFARLADQLLYRRHGRSRLILSNGLWAPKQLKPKSRANARLQR